MDTSVYLLSLLKMKEHYYIFEEQDFLKWYLTLWKTVWYFLIKINIHVPDDPAAVPLPRCYIKASKIRCPHRLVQNINDGLVHNNQILKTTQMSVSW